MERKWINVMIFKCFKKTTTIEKSYIDDKYVSLKINEKLSCIIRNSSNGTIQNELVSKSYLHDARVYGFSKKSKNTFIVLRKDAI